MPAAEAIGLPRGARIALVLGGGNALGAYHAGLYEALQHGGIEPDWIAGTSVGAITGAIIAGNAPEVRVARLRALWLPAAPPGGWPMPWDLIPEEWRRTGAVLATLLGGRAGMFGPLGSSAAAGLADPAAGSPALFDTHVMARMLADNVDFERLNSGETRFSAVAVDVETGEEVVFDTAERRVTADHVRASAAFLTAYPAIEIEGRLLADGGLSLNLPLDPVMASPGEAPVLCIASDLQPLGGARPRTIGEVMGRMQDLTFAAQSRRTIARWQAGFAARDPGDPASVTLVRLAYTAQADEVAGKAMDFSPETVRQRWAAGAADGAQLIERVAHGEIRIGAPGLTV